MQAAASNLGCYASALLDSPTEQEEARAMSVRNLWAWGRFSKIQDNDAKAAAYFETCYGLCKGFKTQTSADGNKQPLENGAQGLTAYGKVSKERTARMKSASTREV